MADEIQQATPAELAAVGYKPSQPMGATPEELAAVGYKQPSSSSGIGDTLEAGGAGFLGEASDLVGHGVSNIGKVVGAIAPQTGQAIQNFAQPTIDLGKQMTAAAQNASPTAATIGKVGADTLGIAALPAASIPQAAGAGAAIGLDLSQGQDPMAIMEDTAKSAVLSAGAATALNLGSKLVTGAGKAIAGNGMLAKISQGASNMFIKPDDYARAALDATLQKTGNDLASATPQTVVDSIQNVMNNVKDQARSYYGIRDGIADANNVMVSKDTVSGLAQQLAADTANGATPEMKKALAAVNSIVGKTGAPIPFNQAQSLLSNVGDSANTAWQQGNSTLARSLGQVKTALQADMDTASAAHPDLQAAQQTANNYYKLQVAPLNNLQMQQQLATKVTEDQFVANLVKNFNKKPLIQAGVAQLPEDVQQGIVSVHQQALQAAANKDDGTVDLAKYATALNSDVVKNSQFYQASNVLPNMQTLAQVVSSGNMSNGIISGGPGHALERGAAGAGIGLMAHGMGSMGLPLAAYGAVRTAAHLYNAGKMISNPAAQDILATIRNTAQYPNSYINKEATSKISQLYNNMTRTIPAGAAAVYGTVSNNMNN